VALGHWGGAASQNLAAPAELAAGEEVGEARELTKDRFLAGVGAERPPAGIGVDAGRARPSRPRIRCTTGQMRGTARLGDLQWGTTRYQTSSSSGGRKRRRLGRTAPMAALMGWWPARLAMSARRGGTTPFIAGVPPSL
jgi:hypothetical protein